MEPRTARGQWFYHGNAIRGSEHKLLRDILAIEQESAADVLAKVEAAVRGISLPPGPDFVWVDGHRPFIAAMLRAIEELRDG